MGMPPPGLPRPPRDTSVDKSLIYDIHKAMPERDVLLNVIRPHDRAKVWLESFMLAGGTFLLDFGRAVVSFFVEPEPPAFRGYQPIETERSEPPQGGSVLASGKYTVQEVANGLAIMSQALTAHPDIYVKPYTPPTRYLASIEDAVIDSEWNSSEGEKVVPFELDDIIPLDRRLNEGI